MLERETRRGRRPAVRRRGGGGALTVTACDGAALVLLIGDLGAAEADQLRARLAEGHGHAPVRIIVDASASTWLCDELVSVLEETSLGASAAGGELVVVDPPPALRFRLHRGGVPVRTTHLGDPW